MLRTASGREELLLSSCQRRRSPEGCARRVRRRRACTRVVETMIHSRTTRRSGKRGNTPPRTRDASHGAGGLTACGRCRQAVVRMCPARISAFICTLVRRRSCADVDCTLIQKPKKTMCACAFRDTAQGAFEVDREHRDTQASEELLRLRLLTPTLTTLCLTRIPAPVVIEALLDVDCSQPMATAPARLPSPTATVGCHRARRLAWYCAAAAHGWLLEGNVAASGQQCLRAPSHSCSALAHRLAVSQ